MRYQPPEKSRRAGVALILVLLVVCVTLALSYAAVRSQFTAVMIQRNAQRGGAARQAATTGITVALKKMHTSGWAGVDTTLAGSLGAEARYQVVFANGDPALDSDDPDYAALPYRVTLTSVGHGIDTDNGTADATYRIQAVVELVPRALADEPSDWSTIEQYTLAQTGTEDVELDIPYRVEGRVRFLGALRFARHYPKDGDAWWRYIGDLGAMKTAGRADYRPFTGPISLYTDKQSSGYLSAMTGSLKVSVVDLGAENGATDRTKPTGLAGYQLYPGGPVYAIPAVGSTLENTTLEGNPETNPLGLFYRDGSVTIGNNVTIRGTLFCKDDVTITGSNVRFESVEFPTPDGTDSTATATVVELPSVFATSDPVRLPVVTCNNFNVESTGGGEVEGLMVVFDKFDVKGGPETATFAIRGRLVTKKFDIDERNEWNALDDHDWADYYWVFRYFQFPPAEPYFPIWMGYQGRSPVPKITIKPGSDSVVYHWHVPGEAIYQPHADDDGLRWDLVSWTDNP